MQNSNRFRQAGRLFFPYSPGSMDNTVKFKSFYWYMRHYTMHYKYDKRRWNFWRLLNLNCYFVSVFYIWWAFLVNNYSCRACWIWEGNNQLSAMSLVDCVPSHFQCARVEGCSLANGRILKYHIGSFVWARRAN